MSKDECDIPGLWAAMKGVDRDGRQPKAKRADPNRAHRTGWQSYRVCSPTFRYAGVRAVPEPQDCAVAVDLRAVIGNGPARFLDLRHSRSVLCKQRDRWRPTPIEALLSRAPWHLQGRDFGTTVDHSRRSPLLTAAGGNRSRPGQPLALPRGKRPGRGPNGLALGGSASGDGSALVR